MLTLGQKTYIESLVREIYSWPSSTIKRGLVLVVEDGDESETADFVRAVLGNGEIVRPKPKSTYRILPDRIMHIDCPIIIDKSQNLLWGRRSNRLQIAINNMVSICNYHEFLVLVSNGGDISYIENIDGRLEWRLRDRYDIRAEGRIE